MHEVADLDVVFTAPGPTTLTAADLSALKAAVKAGGSSSIKALVDTMASINGSITYANWETEFSLANWNTYHTDLVDDLNDTNADYDARFGTDSTDLAIDGIHSQHVSDNVVNAGVGNDVIVLSTGAESNDTIVWTELGNGNDTLVNFEQVGTSAGWQPAVVTIDLDGLEWTPNAGGDTLKLELTAVTETGYGISGNTIQLTATSTTQLSTDEIGGALASTITATIPTLWEASYGDGQLVLIEKGSLNGTSPNVSTVTLTASAGTLTANTAGNLTGSTVFTVTKSDAEITEVAPWEAKLGVDQLDFSSYGAVAAYLVNTHTASGMATPDKTVSGDGGANPVTGTTNLSNSQLTGTYAGGAKYISLEQVENTGGAKAGVYEIVLWQDAQTSGAGMGVANFDNGAVLDTKVGVIGYVDFGQQLSTAYFTGTNVEL
jgi:hypothetical protein